MSENVLNTLQSLVQDVIAPDVRELKVKLAAHQEQTKLQYDLLRDQIAAAFEKADAQYQSLLAAIGQTKLRASLPLCA